MSTSTKLVKDTEYYIGLGYTPETASRVAAQALESEASWVCRFIYTWEAGTDHERRYPRTGQHVGVVWVTSEYCPEGHYTACERCGVTPW